MALLQSLNTFLWLFGLFCVIISNTVAQSQNKRPSSRITSSRTSFGTNVKSSSSSSVSSSATGVNFDCPEEFGYYPHPTDCTQYYVCVFGGALLESCTGGLMYSHELQTCDWPRNVGCEVVDTNERHPQQQQHHQQQHHQQQQQTNSQHVPSRVRFGSAFTSPQEARTQPPQQILKPTIPPQYHRQPPQIIQAQVQTIPPPPEFKVLSNPIGTSRGQPKHILEAQEEIAKLYADAHDTLPPVEEEENDRQQRVYRGQPSTVSQVQKDRDGIIHQASINAIPNNDKFSSYNFGTQYRIETSSPSPSIQLQPATPGTIFIQTARPVIQQNHNHHQIQQQPQVIVETIPSTQTQNRNQQLQQQQHQYQQQLSPPLPTLAQPQPFSQNRNYYNTSASFSNHNTNNNNINNNNQNHDVVSYIPQQQQRQITLQHSLQNQQHQLTQQQQQQSLITQNDNVQQSEQSPYDTYYSVYDDDIDLYRDIEYQQQQQQQQQQQHRQQPQQHQYQQPIRSQPQQSTYRPLEIFTTPAPQSQLPALRETYKPKPQIQERPTYQSNQQPLVYNADYDDDLIAQIEQDNAYDQPTRSPPSRKEQVSIQTLGSGPSSTVRTLIDGNDKRNYYSTLTTQVPPLNVNGPNEYIYETEYVDEPDYYYSDKMHAPTLTTYKPKVKQIFNNNNKNYNVIGTKLKNTLNTHSKNTINARPEIILATSPPAARTTRPTASTISTTTKTTSTTTTTTTPKPSTTKLSKTTSPSTITTTKSRTNSNSNRNRGNPSYQSDRDVAPVTNNRGTHPPRTRPTLKPSGTIVSKAQEFVDIYRNLPSRPEPLYPQPQPDKTAAKCRKDVCLLPDCYCGGRDIPGDLPVEQVPQIVLITFDDSVNDLNKQLYIDLFEKGRVNPNGCPITATFYVSHEWTDYSQVQNLYSDGHEMASHTVSHSFGEQFSQKKWTREVAGQREILAAYGGVKLSDVRGMRAPFLSVGGNKMYKMLYDSNFTYDSSMPVYENRPPSWPYTLDYKIFHDCMIPPCPTKSYPGVWQVPMVMWQDLNGGRCSMGDACSNPSDAEGVTKMIMKNFERHYTTNRAPFGLFYHAAWFTQPHHKEGFIKFLDAINSMPDVWIVTNWQALQWVRDPTPISRINSFQPFQCDYSDRPKRCNNPKVCNLWHKSGVRYMKTCQPCPDIYPWTGKTGIRSSRIDNDIEDSTA